MKILSLSIIVILIAGGCLMDCNVPPAYVSATDGTFCDKIVIRWSSVDGAQEYKIEQYHNGTYISEQNWDADFTATDFYDVTPGVIYTFKVSATEGGCYTPTSEDTGYRGEGPSQPGPISGPTSPCFGSLQTYSVTNVPGVTYSWSLPSEWTGTSTSNSISVTVGSAAGNISVVALNNCGESGSSNLAVNILSLPQSPSNLNATQTAVCEGESTTLTYSEGSGDTFYWYTSSCGEIQIDTGDNLIVSPTVATRYYGRWENECGVSECADILIEINDELIPGISLSPSPSTSVCTGDVVQLNAIPVNEGSFPVYQWYLNGNPVGTNTNSYTTPSLIENSEVYCMLTSGLLCANPQSILSDTTTISMDFPPAKPEEILGETEPIVNNSYSYEISPVDDANNYLWEVIGGSIIGNFNSAIVQWNSPGDQFIYVQAENECGVSESSTLSVKVTEATQIPEVIAEFDFTIYPNPTSDYLFLKPTSNESRNVVLSLVDISGKVLYTKSFFIEDDNNIITLDLADFKSGIYILRINNNDLINIKKIIRN